MTNIVRKNFGFTLLELLVVVAIIAVLSTIVVSVVFVARRKATDTVRKADLNNIGRILWASSCYAPNGGPGDYDIQTIVDEYVVANPAVAQYVSRLPHDPTAGTTMTTGYHYLYDASGNCAFYANLSNPNETVTLPNLTAPTAGGGTGVLQGSGVGLNGTNRYYQVSR